MNKKTIYEKSVKRPRPDGNLSTFGYLFSEIIQYQMSKKRNVEHELQKMGEDIGIRLYELNFYREIVREKKFEKKTMHVEMLKYISSTVWSFLFGKNADKLGQVGDQEHAYFIQDDEPIILKYVSEEQGKGGASFIVGILKGILNSAGFKTTNVDYVDYEKEDNGESSYPSTQFYIVFDPEVAAREK